MKTKVETIEGDQIRLFVTAEKEEVDKRIKSTYQDFAKRYKFPGFRPGKAPRPVIDNVLGSEAVLATVTDEITNTLFPLALDAENIIPIDAPRLENEEAMVEEGQDFTFTYTMTLTPTIELTSYDPVEINLLSENPTDNEVDERIEALREYYYELEDAADDQAIEEGGCAELSLQVKDDKGEAVGVLSSDSRLYELGMGLYPADFDQALVGMKKGDSKTVDLDLDNAVGGVLMRALEGNPSSLTIDVEVLAVKKKVLPEVTEEWAKEKAGFDGLDDLRRRTTDNMIHERKEYLPRMKENACLYKLGERVSSEPPEIMCVEERRGLLQGFFTQLQSQGITFDAYLKQRGMTNDEFQADLKRQAEDMVTQNLAVDAWARHFDMSVSDDEIEEEFEKGAGDQLEEIKKQFHDEGRIRLLRRAILRSKAIDDIMDKAVVTEVTSEELRKINEEASKAADADSDPDEETPAEAAAEVLDETPASDSETAED